VRFHKARGALATIGLLEVDEVDQYGVVILDERGRITGFQEKPDPADALSDLGNCGIYMFSPEIFDYFPDRPFVDWAQDVFPALLESDVPFHIHEIEEYWNDVGSLDELRTGTFDAIRGALRLEVEGQEIDEGLTVGDGSAIAGVAMIEPPVWVGQDVEIGSEVSLQGPLAIGDGARIGDGAALKESVVLPGTDIAPDAILIGAIAGRRGIMESLRRV